MAEPVPHAMIFHSRDYQEILKLAELSTAVPNLYGIRVKPSQYIPRGLVAIVDRDGKLIKVISLIGTNEEVTKANEEDRSPDAGTEAEPDTGQ